MNFKKIVAESLRKPFTEIIEEYLATHLELRDPQCHIIKKEEFGMFDSWVTGQVYKIDGTYFYITHVMYNGRRVPVEMSRPRSGSALKAPLEWYYKKYREQEEKYYGGIADVENDMPDL